jgi:hypothetical protein
MKLDFLCVGAAKSGTTYLQDVLIQHPDIYLPEVKETHFFDRDDDYIKGVDFYNLYFKLSSKSQVRGEITPAYMTYDYIPKRIYETLGKDIKLIFILRNPAKRAFSEYLHNHRRGLIDDIRFKDAIKLEEQYKKTMTPYEMRHFSFLSRGLYGKQISSFLEYFPIENMLIIDFDNDFIKKEDEVIKKIIKFIEVKDYNFEGKQKSNTAYVPKNLFFQKIIHKKNIFKKVLKIILPSFKLRKKIRTFVTSINTSRKDVVPKMDEALNNEIMKLYCDDVILLESITKKNFSHWFSHNN